MLVDCLGNIEMKSDFTKFVNQKKEDNYYYTDSPV